MLRRRVSHACSSKLVIRSDCKASPPHQCFCRLGCAQSAQRPIRPAGIKAGRTFSARFGAVNRKIDTLTQVQAVAAAW
jgi:hypothetical protein